MISIQQEIFEGEGRNIGWGNVAERLEGPEVGIYKRKQESKKTRKQELDQESDQEEKLIFFLITFLVEFLFSCFLDRFLGRVLVFLLSYFLVFFYKFPTQILTRFREQNGLTTSSLTSKSVCPDTPAAWLRVTSL